jgi:hypothetical protein
MKTAPISMIPATVLPCRIMLPGSCRVRRRSLMKDPGPEELNIKRYAPRFLHSRYPQRHAG